MRNTVTTIGRLLKFAAPLWKGIVASFAIGLARVALSLAFVWIGKEMVDIATGVSQGNLAIYIIWFFAIIISLIATAMGGIWWEEYFSVTTRNSLRYDLFRHVLESKWQGREALHSADTVNRLEEDIRVVSNIVCVVLPDILATLVQLVAASIYLAGMQPGLMWILLIIMPTAILGSRLFLNTIRKITTKLRGLDSEVQKTMQESLQNRLVVKTLGSFERTMEKFGWLQEDVRKTTIERLNYNAIARSFMGLGFRGGYAAAFIWSIIGIRAGTVTYGMMTAFLQLVNQLQRPFVDISRHVPAFIQSLTSVERLMELEELTPTGKENDVLLPGAPGIRVENITFRYSDEAENAPNLYENFSFDFQPGKITVITGETGVGKSTLTKIILGLLEPSSGKVELYSCENNSKASVRAGEGTLCNFMYVPQGSSLLSGTIRDNLLLVKPDASDEDMKSALHTATADFVFTLPSGLDTLCSEKGSGLSEGQAQRIAIARALLHSGGIMILDEATSALDNATETRLLENLKKEYSGKKTVIWITHRDSVAKYADSRLEI